MKDKLVKWEWYWTYDLHYTFKSPRQWDGDRWIGVRDELNKFIYPCTLNGEPVRIDAPKENNMRRNENDKD